MFSPLSDLSPTKTQITYNVKNYVVKMSTKTEETMRPMSACKAYLRKECKKRILMLDGAMGSMLQPYNFTEAQFRGDRFKDFDAPNGLRGNKIGRAHV